MRKLCIRPNHHQPIPSALLSVTRIMHLHSICCLPLLQLVREALRQANDAADALEQKEWQRMVSRAC